MNQIVDESVTAEEIARDPVAAVEGLGSAIANPAIVVPPDLFMPARHNAKGWDLTDPLTVDAIEAARAALPYCKVWEGRADDRRRSRRRSAL